MTAATGGAGRSPDSTYLSAVCNSNSTEAGASCPLHYTASGSNATLIAGQSCVSGALTFAYTEGTLAVSGSAMNATLQFTFTGSVNDVTVAGTGTTTFACKNGS